jgi:hypothetical protein
MFFVVASHLENFPHLYIRESRLWGFLMKCRPDEGWTEDFASHRLRHHLGQHIRPPGKQPDELWATCSWGQATCSINAVTEVSSQ